MRTDSPETQQPSRMKLFNLRMSALIVCVVSATGCGNGEREGTLQTAGGQTGEWGGGRACEASSPPLASLTIGVDEPIRDLGISVNGLLRDWAVRTLNEVKYVPYAEGINWNPDLIASVDCGSATLKIEPKVGALATVHLRKNPTAACPSEILLQAQVTLSTKDGALAESIPVELTAYLEGEKPTKAGHVLFNGSQPVADMKGSARPRNASATAFQVSQSSAERISIDLSFSIPSIDTKNGDVVGGSITERYSVWTDMCPSAN